MEIEEAAVLTVATLPKRTEEMRTVQEKQKTISMIEAFSNAFGPSGFEDDVLGVTKAYAGSGMIVEDDSLRNIYLTPRTHLGAGPVLMLDAHCDEVGMLIHSVKQNGLLRFVPLGGWNPDVLPSSKVLVKNRMGELIPGIISSKPVHFMTEEEKRAPLSLETLTIDVGACSAREVVESFHIDVGCPVVSDVSFAYDEERDVMMGKAFDCRVGCAALLETLRRLEGEPCDTRVFGVLSSQEEVGERGIQVAVRRIHPQVALCFEGCPADDTFAAADAIQTALKKGPMLRYMDRSVICNPRFMRYAADLARCKGLPLQLAVRTGGGNNGAVINLAGEGIPVLVIGIPVRYIHSHYGIASYQDFDAAVELAKEIILDLSQELVDSL